MNIKISIQILLIIIIVIVNERISLACSCDIYPVKKELQESTSVFIGKATVVRSLFPKLKFYGGKPSIHSVAVVIEQETTFQVYEVWKGTPQKYIIVKTGEICPPKFEENKEYLVYTYTSEKGEEYVSGCSRTRYLINAGDDLKELGKGNKSLDAKQTKLSLSILIVPSLLMLIIMSLLILFFFWFTKNNKKL